MVGFGGYIVTPKGTFKVSDKTYNQFIDVVCGNGKVIALHEGGFVAISTDYENWSIHDLPTECLSYEHIIYSNGKFILVGGSSTFYVYSSTDGINWTKNTSYGKANETGINVVSGNNKLVTIYVNFSATSSDGTNWSTSHQLPGSNTMSAWNYGLAYGNGKFIALGRNSGSASIITSTDGENWSQPKDLSNSQYKTLSYGNGKFFIGGPDGKIGVSTDGISWNTINIDSKGRTVREVIYTDGQFMAVGWDGFFATSSDGENWVVKDIKDPEKNSISVNAVCPIE